MTTTTTRARRVALAVLATTVGLAGVSACSSSSSSKKTISLVAYSVPKPAYDALATAFGKTKAGKGVTFTSSFGPSGTQAKNVLGGQKADFVNFSVEPDMTKLVPKFVKSDWNSGANAGILTRSVVVIVVRKGNPLHITGWDDLIKPGVQIVTPSPSTSGSAKWNILAAYEHVIANGGTPAQATAYLKAFYKHVISRAQSGSAATAQFTGGTGNVLISYEDEAILARAKGKDVDYVVPDQTVLIENPVAVTTKASQAAKDFLAFAEGKDGQQIFANIGFRPVLAGITPGTVKGAMNASDPYPTPAKLITVASLGGWKKVNDEFFGDSGIDTKIESAG